MVEMSMAGGKEKDDKQDDIIAAQHVLQVQQGKLLSRMSGQIDLILLVLKMTPPDTIAQRWRKMSGTPPMEDGTPVHGGEWLSIDEDFLRARTLRWFANDSILVRVEWDNRPLRRDSL